MINSMTGNKFTVLVYSLRSVGFKVRDDFIAVEKLSQASAPL
jgi:hypothetical protein